MNQNGGIHKGGFAVLCHRNGGSESPGILNNVKDNEVTISFLPKIISASDCIAYLSKTSDIVDLQILDISADEMVAKLYEEYQI